MPPTKPSGRKTATVVRVLLVMAPATSRVPDQHGVADGLAPGPVPVDVLEHHDGVVDHAADGHRQAAQRDDVDGQARRRP